MRECVGRENVEFLETKRKMGWMALLYELPKGVLVPVWLSKVGRYSSYHN